MFLFYVALAAATIGAARAAATAPIPDRDILDLLDKTRDGGRDE